MKRSSAQAFQFFRKHSVPSSWNEYTAKSHESAQPRREEACAVCAVKDWLENRYAVYLFQDGTNTTSWSRFFYGTHDEEKHELEEDGDDTRNDSGAQIPSGQLLVSDDGVFCFGPKKKIHEILNVQRYIAQWPLIPVAELQCVQYSAPERSRHALAFAHSPC